MKAPSKFVKRFAVTTVCVIAIAWVLASAALYRVMRQPPEHFARAMSKVPQPLAFFVLPFETLWLHARAGGLAVGDRAPDFALATLDHNQQIQLSSLTAQGLPAVLVFGSYT